MRLIPLAKHAVVGALTIIALLTAPLCAQADAVRIKIATIPTPSERITHNPARPGWMAEMFTAVEPLAGVKFDYVFTPWDQALRLVRLGRVDAVFNSSFKPDRAEYGAYPMKDGKPDPSRATLRYAYSLYVPEGSAVTWDGTTITGLAGSVGIEKGSAIRARLEKLGLEVREVRQYDALISLAAGGRLPAIAAIPDHIDRSIRLNPERFGGLKRLDPPLQARVGYLMFSSRFCARQAAVCEAVWNGIRDVRGSDAFKEMRATYAGG